MTIHEQSSLQDPGFVSALNFLGEWVSGVRQADQLPILKLFKTRPLRDMATSPQVGPRNDFMAVLATHDFFRKRITGSDTPVVIEVADESRITQKFIRSAARYFEAKSLTVGLKSTVPSLEEKNFNLCVARRVLAIQVGGRGPLPPDIFPRQFINRDSTFPLTFAYDNDRLWKIFKEISTVMDNDDLNFLAREFLGKSDPNNSRTELARRLVLLGELFSAKRKFPDLGSASMIHVQWSVLAERLGSVPSLREEEGELFLKASRDYGRLMEKSRENINGSVRQKVRLL